MAVKFGKTYTSPADIICLLKQRGLQIDDADSAEHVISNVGYYRFSAYLYPFLTQPKELHLFKPSSQFRSALNLYRFDKKLRPNYHIYSSCDRKRHGVSEFQEIKLYFARYLTCVILPQRILVHGDSRFHRHKIIIHNFKTQ